jgi:cytochrome c-type biogenesis protein CcmE
VKAKHRRLGFVAAGVLLLAAAAGLVLYAMNDSLVFFYTPSEVQQKLQAKQIDLDRPFRLGGLVEAGSVERDATGVNVRFRVTDTVDTLTVAYQGILPDLFREGQGVVAQGRLGADGVFTATEVLAKHDENYMPAEVAAALKKQGHWEGPEGYGSGTGP